MTLRVPSQLVLDRGCCASVEYTGASSRLCAYPTASAPLAVSGPRGVACVFAGLQRVLLYDLEDNEDSEGDEEDEGSEELSEPENSGHSAEDDESSMISAAS